MILLDSRIITYIRDDSTQIVTNPEMSCASSICSLTSDGATRKFLIISNIVCAKYTAVHCTAMFGVLCTMIL